MRKSIFKGNTYVSNNDFPSGEVVVISTQCNRNAMRYEDISENTRCGIQYIWIDKTHKPVSIPPSREVHGASKLDCVTVWFLG
jgi:hypothetical protein